MEVVQHAVSMFHGLVNTHWAHSSSSYEASHVYSECNDISISLLGILCVKVLGLVKLAAKR
jgi:hypothetical protein